MNRLSRWRPPGSIWFPNTSICHIPFADHGHLKIEAEIGTHAAASGLCFKLCHVANIPHGARRSGMSYTLNEAAKAVGKSKTTIHRAIKSGKISASKLESGAYAIDPSELHRVFQVGTEECTTRNGTERRETADIRLEMLEKERERERQLLEETIADLREDRDKWRQQATALLEDKRPKGLLRRLFG